MAQQKDAFLSQLNKIYGGYVGGFAVFVLLLAGLEQMGVPNRVIGYLFVALTIGVYAYIGILSRTMQVSEYYVAGRRVPAIYNGMATGSDWMSAASFIGMAGSLYALGYGGLAFILGWTGGYMLVAVLIAPYLRKFGQYTVPDFLGARYGGNLARFVGVTVLITASFVYVVAQIVGVGIITQRFLDVSFAVAVFIGLGGILVCSMLGGMRAVTWTQVAQYIVLIIAYLIPAILMSVKLTGVPIPQLMYGIALEKIEALEATMRAAGQVMLPHTQAFAGPNQQFDLNRAINFFALVFCLMVGTASLPHILMRYFTTPSVREARQSVAWSLFFIFLLYFTAPAYAAFAKLEVYQNVIGQRIDALPAWLENWRLMSPYGVPWVNVVDRNNDGILQLAEFSIHPDVIVLATPEIAGLPYVIAGLVAAGGLAAALSTADGLLLAIANALSHDIYYRMIDRHAPTKRRLIVARTILISVAVVAAYTAGHLGADILFLVAWAFSIAAAGLFAALVLGVWDKKTNSTGAIAGMVVGYVVTFGYLLWSEFAGLSMIELVGSKEAIIRAYQQYVAIPTIAAEAKAPIQALLANQAAITDGPLHGGIFWGQTVVLRNRVTCQLWAINNISGGIFGVPLAFLVTYVVSRLTTAPSQAMQDFIESIRIPRGGVKLVDREHAVD
ncbi:cation acetate symporter [Elioraea sp. Yellowstone]|jgi:cation/acetate symporter|uniref:sodium:solute symporter family protein n=1 Tax=Elioraea sp. Yellowstone TaxID=2592070 RepID=UPI00114F50B1|nr:sodium:solute symporter family protein [Elioraea sp. Yellowstone]TQF76477.1 cation acetate symporter [Elioraea sp. Yellowstone]